MGSFAYWAATPGPCGPSPPGFHVGKEGTMARRSLWAVLGAALIGAAVATASAASAGTVAAPKAPNPYGDPNLVSIFDGKTLNGWTQSKAGLWSVANGAIHGNGTARGWIYYKQQAGTFRWIFWVRQVSGNHAPTVLIWGTTVPLRDALSAIQFQPPNGGHWGYPAGHHNGGGKPFSQGQHPKSDPQQRGRRALAAHTSTRDAQKGPC